MSAQSPPAAAAATTAAISTAAPPVSSGPAAAAAAGGGKTVIRLELNKYINQRIIVKFHGGRQVSGVLKGFDDICNLVLDECKETLRDTQGELTTRQRGLGVLVARGTGIMMLCTEEGYEEIPNPFTEPQPVI